MSARGVVERLAGGAGASLNCFPGGESPPEDARVLQAVSPALVGALSLQWQVGPAFKLPRAEGFINPSSLSDFKRVQAKLDKN